MGRPIRHLAGVGLALVFLLSVSLLFGPGSLLNPPVILQNRACTLLDKTRSSIDSFLHILSLRETAEAACIPRPSFTLTVSKSGPGSGTVSSTPTGINCGAGCTQSYNVGTPVALVATPGTNSTFLGWSGGGCAGTGACMLTVNGNISVTANFDLPAFTLTVAKKGSGAGTVTGTGINCGTDCSESYGGTTTVTLTASSASGSTFIGWSGGGCIGTGTCMVTVDVSKTVFASFSKIFTDDPLTALGLVKAVHITELREAISNLRSNNGLTAFSFADPTLSASATQVRGAHITELRTALSGVYNFLGATPPAYSDPTIPTGQITIKMAHISEVRSAVRALESE